MPNAPDIPLTSTPHPSLPPLPSRAPRPRRAPRARRAPSRAALPALARPLLPSIKGKSTRFDLKTTCVRP
ncbi:hypothetical protein Pa4123_87270 [Phytohabitans aurantiacus]|uniref:Uncharacterized protein n=1 Tax=Phytohabitans aurantiacus TaxID=3016789 RepID=A0ABQ5R9L0_9ACTN|nr:hypothetical protein Pa4123_87270 [Phytohabitans aurantiacus]